MNGNISPVKRILRAGSFSLEKTGSEELIHVYEYLMGGSKDDRARLLIEIPNERTRGNGHRLKNFQQSHW